jgi:hypothetical protein
LPHASTYTFKCVLNHSQTLTTLKQNDLTLVQDTRLNHNYSDVVLGTTGLGQTSAQRTVEFNTFKNKEKGGSYKEDILTCNNVCSVNLIVFPEKLSGSKAACGAANSFQCNVSKFEEDPANSANVSLFPRTFDVDVGPTSCKHELIKAYSIFDPMGNETWLDCEKLGVNKTKVTIKNHAEDYTKSIDCPLFLSNFEPRPLIIRIEEKCKKICGLMFDPNCNAGSNDIIDTEYISARVDAEDLELVRVAGIGGIDSGANNDMMIILIVFGVIFLFALCLVSIKLARTWYKRHNAKKEIYRLM